MRVFVNITIIILAIVCKDVINLKNNNKFTCKKILIIAITISIVFLFTKVIIYNTNISKADKQIEIINKAIVENNLSQYYKTNDASYIQLYSTKIRGLNDMWKWANAPITQYNFATHLLENDVTNKKISQKEALKTYEEASTYCTSNVYPTFRIIANQYKYIIIGIYILNIISIFVLYKVTGKNKEKEMIGT